MSSNEAPQNEWVENGGSTSLTALRQPPQQQQQQQMIAQRQPPVPPQQMIPQMPQNTMPHGNPMNQLPRAPPGVYPSPQWAQKPVSPPVPAESKGNGIMNVLKNIKKGGTKGGSLKDILKEGGLVFIVFMICSSKIFTKNLSKFIPQMMKEGQISLIGTIIGGLISALLFIILRRCVL